MFRPYVRKKASENEKLLFKFKADYFNTEKIIINL